MQCKKEILVKPYMGVTGSELHQEASASAKFNNSHIIIDISAIAKAGYYQSRYDRGYAYASICIGTILPITNIGRYTKLSSVLQGSKLTGCIRTGDANNENTSITTATGIASGTLDLDFMAGNYPGNIVLNNACGEKQNNFSYTYDKVSYSYSYTTTITEIWLE